MGTQPAKNLEDEVLRCIVRGEACSAAQLLAAIDMEASEGDILVAVDALAGRGIIRAMEIPDHPNLPKIHQMFRLA